MKIIYLVIGIVVIVAIVCSPALAISKNDLIAQYKGQSSPTTPTPAPQIPSGFVVPTTAPTQVPTRTGILTIYRIAYGIDGAVWREIDYSKDVWGAKVYLDGTFKGYTPLTITGVPIGSHQVKVTSQPQFQYKEYVNNVTVVENEQTIVEVYISGAVATPTPIPTKPTPTSSPLTLDIYPYIPASYPIIPASYYEWSKFPAPPEPTPRVISDEEFKEITDRYRRAFA